MPAYLSSPRRKPWKGTRSTLTKRASQVQNLQKEIQNCAQQLPQQSQQGQQKEQRDQQAVVKQIAE
jgi:hypothetical protein